jgi:hypothetical protein
MATPLSEQGPCRYPLPLPDRHRHTRTIPHTQSTRCLDSVPGCGLIPASSHVERLRRDPPATLIDRVAIVHRLRPSYRRAGVRGLGLDRIQPLVPQLLNPLIAPVTHRQPSLIAWVKLSTARHGVQVVRNVGQLRASFQFAHNAKRMYSFVRPCEPGRSAVISSCCCRCPVIVAAGAIARTTAAVANQSAAPGLSTRAGWCKGYGL